MKVASLPTGTRVAIATGAALLLTVGQLGLVAWLNHAEHKAEPPTRRVPLPILAPPPRPQPPPPPEPTTSLPHPSAQDPIPQPLAVVEPSAVPNLPDIHSPTDHIAVLPGLEAGDLGPMAVGALNTNAQPDTPARPLRRPQPSYPPAAKRRRIEGFVTVRLRLDASGRVIDAVVVDAEPPGVFEDAAVQAARRYVFAPAVKNGQASDDTVEQRIVFRLRQ